MPVFGDDQGKTEKPTPGKLAETRKKGDTPLSRELVQGGVLFIAAIMLLWLGKWLIDSLSTVMRTGLTLDMRNRNLSEVGGICAELWRAFTTILPPFLTLLIILVVSTLLLGYGQIGVKYASEAVGFKPEKLNPFTNLKRVSCAPAHRAVFPSRECPTTARAPASTSGSVSR